MTSVGDFNRSDLLALSREAMDRPYVHDRLVLHGDPMQPRPAARYVTKVLSKSYSRGQVVQDPLQLNRVLKILFEQFAKETSSSTLSRRVAALEAELRDVAGRLATLEQLAATEQQLDSRFERELAELSERLQGEAGEEPEDFDFSGAFEELG